MGWPAHLSAAWLVVAADDQMRQIWRLSVCSICGVLAGGYVADPSGDHDSPTAAAASAVSSGRGATGSTETSGGAARLRLVRRPAAFLYDPRSPTPTLQIRMQFNRTPPENSGGGEEARVEVHVPGAHGDVPPERFGRRPRHCYTAYLFGDLQDRSLRRARPGRRVRVTVRRYSSMIVYRGTITVRAFSRKAVASLGCGSSPPPTN